MDYLELRWRLTSADRILYSSTVLQHKAWSGERAHLLRSGFWRCGHHRRAECCDREAGHRVGIPTAGHHNIMHRSACGMVLERTRAASHTSYGRVVSSILGDYICLHANLVQGASSSLLPLYSSSLRERWGPSRSSSHRSSCRNTRNHSVSLPGWAPVSLPDSRWRVLSAASCAACLAIASELSIRSQSVNY